MRDLQPRIRWWRVWVSRLAIGGVGMSVVGRLSRSRAIAAAVLPVKLAGPLLLSSWAGAGLASKLSRPQFRIREGFRGLRTGRSSGEPCGGIGDIWFSWLAVADARMGAGFLCWGDGERHDTRSAPP
jgi:hypothetical protein